MKKKFFITVSVFVTVAMLLCLSGCMSNKTPQTAEGFTQIMEEKGFEVADATEDIETNGVDARILVATGKNYQIQFHEFEDSDTGKLVFLNGKEVFDDKCSVKSMSLEMNTTNYNYYSFSSGKSFYLIARIEHTVISCVAEKEYKSEIIDLVKTLGYR